jgi:hypothetical protein
MGKTYLMQRGEATAHLPVLQFDCKSNLLEENTNARIYAS